MKNTTVIFFIIIFLLLAFFIYNLSINMENFSNNLEPKLETVLIDENKSIEIKVENFGKNDELNLNNLIKNGNFENGQNSSNHVNQSGFNKIVVKKNPGKSSYVLYQKNTDFLTYYEIQCDNDKNSKYHLYFWLNIGNNTAEDTDFSNLIHIKFQNEDFSNFIPHVNYNIIQKIILSNNEENTWYLVKYSFISGPQTLNKMNIFFNYSTKLQYSEYYFTDLALYKVLIDAENFIYNHKLICYVDGYNYQSNIPTWHDLSGNGNDLFWSNIPDSDLTIGSLSTLNQKVVGFQSNKITNDKFTILFCLNKKIENSVSDIAVEAKNSIHDFYLLSIPGNDRYAFEIKWKDNYFYIVNGKDEYKTKNEIILYNKSLLAIIYDNNSLNLYLDNVNILSAPVKKLYFANDTFTINKNKNLNFNFYSILFYNRIVSRKELDNIRSYFIMNKDKNFSSPDINIHHMFNTADITANQMDYNDPNSLFKPFSKELTANQSVINNFIDTFDNKNYKDHCIADCDKLCNLFNEKGECVNNCKSVLLSCQNYCKDPQNSNSMYCTTNSDLNVNTDCPRAYKKNNKYWVYVPPNSIYANKNNYSGDRVYSEDREKARYMYNINFPNCPIPPELLPGEGKSYTESCPYVINELNPCHTSVCAGVNWNVKNYKDLNMNKNCKKAVSNYCQLYYNIDDNCSCWNPINKNNAECAEYRRYFEDPNDYCSPSQFKIEEHPDFNKYIKKDNIPCWGCKIE